MKYIYIKQFIFFILIILMSCTSETKPTVNEVAISKRFDSITRVLSKLDFKVETMPISLQIISRSEVNTLIAAAVKVPNDKIAAQDKIITAQGATITKLVADTTLKSKRIKALEDSSVFISPLNFSMDKNRVITIKKP